MGTTKQNVSASLLESENFAICDENQIMKEEKLQIVINKGKRKKFATNIAELFGIPRKNIQIGNSIITKQGVISHVVHFVNDSDLEQLAVALDEESVSIKQYIDMLYASLSKQMNKVCQRHFGLSEDFVVDLNHVLSMKTRTMSPNIEPSFPLIQPQNSLLQEGLAQEGDIEMITPSGPTTDSAPKPSFVL